MTFKNYRDESRKVWGTESEGNLDREQITLGCMLRIADSVEKLTADRVQLEKDLAWYKERYQSNKNTIQSLERSNAALRGQITRLKKKNQCLNNQP